MEQEKFYFRIKSSWIDEQENGTLSAVKSEDLVMATCYTDAESIALELLNGKERFGNVSYEIIKTKITEILYNDTLISDNGLTLGLVECYFDNTEEDSETGLYAVNIIYSELNEKSGKERTSKETLYTPAKSTQKAIDFVKKYLSDSEQRDWLIRDVKFDKAKSIFMSPNEYKQKADTFSKYK